MGNLFAEIKNNIVVNVMIADYEFAKFHSEQNGCDVVEFQEHPQDDDTLVARIGELYIDGKFVSVNQAVELGTSGTITMTSGSTHQVFDISKSFINGNDVSQLENTSSNNLKFYKEDILFTDKKFNLY